MIAFRRRPLVLPENPMPWGSYLHCPHCGEILHSHAYDEPVDPYEVEKACQAHLYARHRVRLWLYQKFEWKWPIRGIVG